MVSPLKRLIKVFVVSLIVIITYLLIDGKVNAIYLATEKMFGDLEWTEEILEPHLNKHLQNLEHLKDLKLFKQENLTPLNTLDSIIQATKKQHNVSEYNVLMFIGKDSLQFRMDFDSTKQYLLQPISDIDKGLVEENNTNSPQAKIFVQIDGDNTQEFVGLFSPVKKVGEFKVVYAICTPSQSWFQIIKDELFTNVLVIILVIGITLFFTIRSVKKIVKNEDEIKTQLFNTNHELNKKNEEITDSIKYAKTLQDAILMNEKEVSSLLPNSFIYYQPKDIVAGDFYWVFEYNQIIYFAAADCTGHGVPGAMVSMLCANALSRVAVDNDIFNAALVLDKTRAEIIKSFTANKNVKDGMDISLLMFNKQSAKLQWAGAYNPLWVINKLTGSVKEYKGDKQPIAAFAEMKPFTNYEIELNNGDVFYLFSDGYADQFGGPKNKKFRYKPMQELLLSISTLPFAEQKQELERVFKTWKGQHEQIDDVLLMGVEFI